MARVRVSSVVVLVLVVVVACVRRVIMCIVAVRSVIVRRVVVRRVIGVLGRCQHRSTAAKARTACPPSLLSTFLFGLGA